MVTARLRLHVLATLWRTANSASFSSEDASSALPAARSRSMRATSSPSMLRKQLVGTLEGAQVAPEATALHVEGGVVLAQQVLTLAKRQQNGVELLLVGLVSLEVTLNAIGEGQGAQQTICEGVLPRRKLVDLVSQVPRGSWRPAPGYRRFSTLPKTARESGSRCWPSPGRRRTPPQRSRQPSCLNSRL